MMRCWVMGHTWMDLRTCRASGYDEDLIVERVCRRCTRYSYVRVSLYRETEVVGSMARAMLDASQGQGAKP